VNRLVHAATRESANEGETSLLSLRVGTKFGVISHTFRVETKADLAYWTKAISHCLQSAVVRTKEVVFRMCFLSKIQRKRIVFVACKWNNRPCKLFLHYEHGFTLYNDPTDSVLNGESSIPNGTVRLLWQQPFEKLRSSADDNEHLLTLDFHGEEGVVVRLVIILFFCLFEIFRFVFLGIRFWFIAQTICLPFTCFSFSQSCTNWSYRITKKRRNLLSFNLSLSLSLTSSHPSNPNRNLND